MKKVKSRKPLDLLLFFILGIGVGIAFGMSSALLIRHNIKEKKKEYRYEIVSLSNCDNKVKLYYQEEKRNVYLYCLNSIKVKENNNLLELKNYVQNHPNEIEEMVRKMTLDDDYRDGESILYHDYEQLSTTGFSILMCSTLDGDKDIYIGPKFMKYESGLCQVEKNK